jgi:acyl dehydratase
MECRYGKRRGAPTDRGELSHCSAKELMTTHLEEPADLLDLVGSPLGTTKWMKLSQQRVDLFAESTGDHQWIHTDP